ncbi:hypothetical protein FPRO05_02224 [Fusarium proliferatum]|uniref:Glycosyltransferase 2-like domain-containing protein n=1 Tax=Gibberella intermedia TaxID=948311 RepID=A0A365MY12_GIBIN|nr:hypothetical protein FPRO05_02224 [Fusarium proliferatum]
MGTVESIDSRTQMAFTNVSQGRHLSILKQLLNFTGCLMIIPAFYLATIQTLYPMTIDILFGIILTECNRFANERRRISFYSTFQRENNLKRQNLGFMMKETVTKLDCLSAVVGYREDPALFTRALESYKAAHGQAFMLVGIDAIQHEKGREINESESNKAVIQQCMSIARVILDQQGCLIDEPDGIRHICLVQQHMHKKGIMFTTFIFSLVIAEMLGIEFMWSSDSDTIVLEDTLERTISTIAGDSTIGGASSGLTVHNGDDTVVTRLAATVYWAELYLTRSTPACTATSDCQSGPCTAFRLSALSSILMPWYMQKVFGKRMIVNEDRHLTTNLLVGGWGVVFASDVLTATETPTTVTRWLRQQVRWARATHIESLLIPRVYGMSHPMAFFAAARREFGPLVVAVAVLSYFFTSHKLLYFSYRDLFLRISITTIYNILRNPDRLRLALCWYVVPGMFFYNIPLPAIHIWSLVTMTADTWGTAMRASTEISKKDSSRKKWFETGFFVVWMGIVGGTVARWLANEFGLYQGQTLVSMLCGIWLASFCSWKATIESQ